MIKKSLNFKDNIQLVHFYFKIQINFTSMYYSSNTKKLPQYLMWGKKHGK